MALDGIFLSKLKGEILTVVSDSRVEKVHQPSKEEIVLHFRGRNGSCKLLISAKADAARMHFIETAPENPAVPPMFCMLMRKYLTNAKLIGISQDGFERALVFEFESTNELGDKIYPCVAVEIMARHSNIVLVGDDKRIIDAVKRVDITKSSVRQILPGLEYHCPPKQCKMNIVSDSIAEMAQKVVSSEKRIDKAFQDVLQGVSPVICRELAHLSMHDGAANDADKNAVTNSLEYFKNCVINASSPVMLVDTQGKMMDFTFMPITQYANMVSTKKFDSYSTLLDAFYFQRERLGRIKQRSQSLFKHLNVLLERSVRKCAAQKEQLKECENKEKYKVYGDLINANLYCLEKGSAYYDLQNFYDENMPEVRISADPALTPIQNAQKYYKEYRKLQTAQTMLYDLIEQSSAETQYLESVLDALSRADTERELSEIKAELTQGGYVKSVRSSRKKQPKALPPHEFVSSDGFRIRVGRNNVQNDKLTLKESKNYDMWLHTKDIPGSHVIISSDNKEISQTAILEAAKLAALFSKASDSSNVPVDYTIVKNVKKPQGAKPGRVIYDFYNTVYVTPDEKLAQDLSAEKE